MELKHLRSFIAVAEALNFRRAAESISLSQPGLSSQIRLLETDVGTQLLDRSTHHVALTAAGRRFLTRARQLLRDADDAIVAAQREAAGETGEITLGFVPSLTYHRLPLLLRAFRRQMPKVALKLIEMDTEQQIEALATHRIDLGFVGLGLTQKTGELQLCQVDEERLVAVMADDHPILVRRKRKQLKLSELAHIPLYLAARETAPLYNPWIFVLCQQAGFQPNVVLEAGQPATAISYAAAGMGVTILPAQFGRICPPGVRYIPLAKPAPRYRYFAAWSDSNLHPALPKFVEIARAGKWKQTAGASP